ncbi:MAG TPA: hypothetical protein VGL59_20125 [Polyangia bacterium]|jgi:hypothetical protein
MNRWLFAIVWALASCGSSADSPKNGGTDGAMTSQDAGSGDTSAGGAKDVGTPPEDSAVEVAVDTPASADRFVLPDSADATGADALADSPPKGSDARPDGIPMPRNDAPPCDPALKVANGAPCQSQGVVFSCILQPEAGPALLCICANILQNRWACGPDNGGGGVMAASR